MPTGTRLVTAAEHLEVVIGAVRRATRSVWIATANVKEMRVPGATAGRRWGSVLSVLDDRARAGVDARFLYLGSANWTGAAWAGALSAAKDDLDLIVELPIAGDLVLRVVELDEDFERGAAYEFLISYEAGRPGGDRAVARAHYVRALAASGGLRASTYLTLAEAVSVGEQDLAEFHSLIEAALAVDPDRVPEDRLANTIARERAEWLRGRMPELFLLAEIEETAQ